MRSAGETWYRGTADAIYQNINLIEQTDPDVVVIFGAAQAAVLQALRASDAAPA